MRKGTKTRFNQPGMVLTREGLCQDGVDEVCVSVGAGNCFLLGGLVDGGDEAVSTPLSPVPPRCLWHCQDMQTHLFSLREGNG